MAFLEEAGPVSVPSTCDSLDLTGCYPTLTSQTKSTRDFEEWKRGKQQYGLPRALFECRFAQRKQSVEAKNI